MKLKDGHIPLYFQFYLMLKNDIMLGEIARKQEEEQAAREESVRRQQESHADEAQEATTADSA